MHFGYSCLTDTGICDNVFACIDLRKVVADDTCNMPGSMASVIILSFRSKSRMIFLFYLLQSLVLFVLCLPLWISISFFCAYHFGYQYIIQFSHKVEFKVSSLLDKLTSFSHELYIGHCNCVVKLTSFHINYILDIVIMWSGTCVGTKLKNGKSYQPFRVFHLFFDIIFFADSYHPSSNHNHKKNFPGASVVKR